VGGGKNCLMNIREGMEETYNEKEVKYTKNEKIWGIFGEGDFAGNYLRWGGNGTAENHTLVRERKI